MSLLASSRFLLTPATPALKKALSSPQKFLPILSATITSKAFREPTSKPAPFPYKEKNYSVWRSIFDRTSDRFDENSKILIVEGPVASGKTAFAKRLAEELDMLHIPEANMDVHYINEYGYDMRKVDPQLPKSMQSYDEKNFCQNPHHENAISFQVWMYRLRFSLYIDALAHVLSTGQGVVMERSPWGDLVFAEAMFDQGYINKNALRAYHEIRRNTIHQLLKPHLMIYLDVPVPQVLENIKKRNNPWEKSSKALTPAYLEKMEEVYKTKYLKDLSEHAELLMYDWSESGDVEVIVEDIERIDFEKYTEHDKKMKDWRQPKEQAWADLRMMYADEKKNLVASFNIPLVYCPELWASGEDMNIYEKVWYNAPGMKYEHGFNQEMGDSGLFTRTRSEKYVY